MAAILLDVDGVLADLIGHTIERGRQQAPELEHPAYEDIFDYSFESCIRDPEVIKLYRSIFRSKMYAYNLPLIEGAVDGVAALRLLGHEVFFVTAPYYANYSWVSDRMEWLKKFFRGTPEMLISTHAKKQVRGDLLIDDSCTNVSSFESVNGPGSGLVFAQPWNNKPGYTRASGWPAVVEYVKSREDL